MGVHVLSFAAALVTFGILIVVHEFGHFVFAKLTGISVARFSVGFGPVLWKREFRNTRYQLAAIPFGGFVHLVGQSRTREGNEHELKMLRKKLSPAAYAACTREEERFANRPGWAQFLTAIGGPIFSVIFGLVLMTGINVMVGEPYTNDPLVLEIVLENSPAASAGLQPGDVVTQIDGQSYPLWFDFSQKIARKLGRSVEIAGSRDGEPFSYTITPERDPESSRYVIGVQFAPQTIENRNLSVSAGATKALRSVQGVFVGTYMFVARAVTGKAKIKEVRGPVGILDVGTEIFSTGILAGISFASFLSVVLGVTQLIPIPPLDGSRVLLALWKIVFGTEAPEFVVAPVMIVGVAFLLTLAVMVTYHDLMRLFS